MAANTIRTIMIIISGSEMVLCSHGAGFPLLFLSAQTEATHTHTLVWNLKQQKKKKKTSDGVCIHLYLTRGFLCPATFYFLLPILKHKYVYF